MAPWWNLVYTAGSKPAARKGLRVRVSPVLPFIRKDNNMDKSWISQKIAQMLPHSVVYWAAVRLMANATQGEYSKQVVPELTCLDALKRWKI